VIIFNLVFLVCGRRCDVIIIRLFNISIEPISDVFVRCHLMIDIMFFLQEISYDNLRYLDWWLRFIFLPIETIHQSFASAQMSFFRAMLVQFFLNYTLDNLRYTMQVFMSLLIFCPLINYVNLHKTIVFET
jgi:hypothetical protein